MTGVLRQLDMMPRPFVIAGMVIGFILFWPIGLAVLAYLIWSRRMGCASNWSYAANDPRHAARAEMKMQRWEEKSQRFMDRMNEKMERWGGRAAVLRPTGNTAFDEYREDTLRRLEDEAKEFESFMARLRMARDKAEFDQYMADRRSRDVTVTNEPGQDAPRNDEPKAA
jgi:Protein of unknown function (DUF2852)